MVYEKGFTKTIMIAVKTVIAVCCLVAVFAITGQLAFAQEINSSDVITLEEQCALFTDDRSLQVDSDHTITEYEAYIDEHFEIGARYASAGITDEWLFQIVPKAVFDLQPEDFLYIGEKYGFYVDYWSETDEYFVYLLLHNAEMNETSGHLVRELRPLYYERYVYDAQAGTATLKCFEGVEYDPVTESPMPYRYFKKYSDEKDIFIKDVAFAGMLYNTTHPDYGNEDYFAAEDRGGYFIGNSYLFKGVSLSSGETEYSIEYIKFALGCIPVVGDYLGTVFSVTDLVETTLNNEMAAQMDYRDTLTNDNPCTFRIEEIDAADQIAKHGALLKSKVSFIETPDDEGALLFGIESENYVRSTMYCSFPDSYDKWNTNYVGSIKFDIVEEVPGVFGSTVETIATVESTGYVKQVYDEEQIDLQLGEE